MPPTPTMIRFDDDVHALLTDKSSRQKESINRIVNAALREQLQPDNDLVSARDWENYGFDEVDEIVPGRLYEVWADHDLYRISVTRAILSGSTVAWNSSIDRLALSAEIDPHHADSTRVWTQPSGIADRLRGETQREALHDAARWLAEYAGVDAVSRARRDVEEAQLMEPALRAVVDLIDAGLSSEPTVIDTWRDRNRARWSTHGFDFLVARDDNGFVLSSYESEGRALLERLHYRLDATGAKRAVQRIRKVASKTPRPIRCERVSSEPENFHGLYSLREIEAIAGDFTNVLMKPVPARALTLPHPDDQMLTTVGYGWPCGCETRGRVDNDAIPTLLWAACPDHGSRRVKRPERPIPADLHAVYRVSRAAATVEPGGYLLAPRIGSD